MTLAGFDPLQLITLLILLGLNSFFVAAEYALVAARPTRLEELARGGDLGARQAIELLRDRDRFIATSQLGITMAGLGLGWVGEPALSGLIQDLLGFSPGLGQGSTLAHALSSLLAFAIVTYVAVVVSELVPKSLTLGNPERIAAWVCRPLIWAAALARPLVWLLQQSARGLLGWVGATAEVSRRPPYSTDELKLLVVAAERTGALETTEREMLHAVFDFGDLRVREVMVPRTEMAALSAESTLEEMIQLSSRHPYSKFPVYEGDLDHILGLAHVKDLVAARRSPPSTSAVRGLLRETFFVPENMRVQDLLREFRARRQHLAIVLDEYGGTAGLVTLEDLLEEIVGEVADVFDKRAPDIKRLPEGGGLIDGLVSIEDVNDSFGLRLADPNYDTIAGYMLGRLGRVAKVGDQVDVEGYQLRVEAMDHLRIASLSLSPRNPRPLPSPPVSS